MKHFIDTEFLEGTQTKYILGIPFGKTKPTIDLISIGIISEDNRELYLISKDFNLKEAWNRYDLKLNMDYKPSYGGGSDGHYNPMFIKEYWIRENVLKPIYETLKLIELQEQSVAYSKVSIDIVSFSNEYKELKRLIQKYGKTNEQIAEEVKYFVYGIKNIDAFPTKNEAIEKMNIQFYGYYSAYDHVTLCWLFGKMIDLPNRFPMYTRDLKQMLDEYDEGATLSNIKNHPNYPKVTNSHNALSDAKWNKALYEFLNNL